MCLFGALFATGLWSNLTNNAGSVPGWLGYSMLCVAILFIAIAVVVPILLLRKKKPAAGSVEVLPPQEPLPPAS
jgi:hypothetical protein